MGAADPEIPPEREQEGMMLMHRMEDAILQAQPNDGERCKECKWYLGFDDIAYCWHQKIRMLVGYDWWCQWFETEEESEELQAYQETANPIPGKVG
jgi:hypothetical protein